jgi:hypothetical protein
MPAANRTSVERMDAGTAAEEVGGSSQRAKCGGRDATYHSTDFDFDEWAAACTQTLTNTLPPIATISSPSGPSSSQTLQQQEVCEGSEVSWDNFYCLHSTARVYKPRRYIYPEFKHWIDSLVLDPARNNSHNSGDDEVVVLEIGCGHGCTMFPLLQLLQSNTARPAETSSSSSSSSRPQGWRYIASDCSAEGLKLIQSHPLFVAHKDNVDLVIWNCEQAIDTCQFIDVDNQHSSDCRQTPIRNVRTAFCIFTLSAVSPSAHIRCLLNIAETLAVGGVLLFRDYAVHDMTMHRHTTRLGEYLFQRPEGTLAYYFDKNYLASIAAEAGFVVKELEYACVELSNRKHKHKKGPGSQNGNNVAEAAVVCDDEIADVLPKQARLSECMRRVFIHAVLMKI